MLDLDDPRWRELTHAFGSAEDAPHWIRAIREDPTLSSHDMQDAFGGMNNFVFNTIIHQGDIYTASYAVLPHLVQVVATNPTQCSLALVSVVSWIETSRLKGRGPAIPT